MAQTPYSYFQDSDAVKADAVMSDVVMASELSISKAVVLPDPLMETGTCCALEVFLAVHQDDRRLCEDKGEVPLRLYSATQKDYIGLRVSVEDAMERAFKISGQKADVSKHSYSILSVRFTPLGFSKYATHVLEGCAVFKTQLYKIVYPFDGRYKDYGAWAFHGNLPLDEKAENGDALVVTSWLFIE